MSEKNEIKDIVEAIYQVKIAVASLNPDPMQTIQEYRDKQALNRRLSYFAIAISILSMIVSVAT